MAAVAEQMGLALKEKDYSMQRFVEKYARNLPVIIIITSGYLGYDEEHTFSSDEVYLIYGIKAQPRVVVTDKDSRDISIPLDYSHKFQVVLPSGELGEKCDLSTLIAHVTTTGKGDKIIIEDDAKVSLTEGTSYSPSESLGHLNIRFQYDEKYLVAFTIDNSTKGAGNLKCVKKPTLIPVYMPIRLGVVKGLAIPGSFEELIKKLTPVNFNAESAQTNQNVMQMPENRESDYEYVTPNWVEGATTDKVLKKKVDDIRHNYEPVDPPVVLPSASSTQAPVAIKRPPLTPTQSTPPAIPKKSWEVSPTPTTPPPVPEECWEVYQTPGIPPPLPERSSKSTSVNTLQIPEKNKTDPKPPVLPHRSHPQPPTRTPPTPAPRTATDQSQQRNQNSVNQRKQRSQNAAAGRAVASVSPINRQQTLNTSERPGLVRASPNPARVQTIDEISEVPTDLSTLSICQVSQCLRLLDLEKHVNNFQTQGVDGTLISDMKKEMLLEDFGLGGFEALKLFKFIKGWRPEIAHTAHNQTINDIMDIPTDLSTLSICQVSQCLRLLELDKHVNNFQIQRVDGTLLSGIEEVMLREDFGLGGFEALKLFKFIKGWRPKI